MNDILRWVVAAIVIVAAVAIAQAVGVPIPGFVITILWVIAGAMLAIAAIRFLVGFASRT